MHKKQFTCKHHGKELRAAPRESVLKREVQDVHGAAQSSSKRSCSEAE